MYLAGFSQLTETVPYTKDDIVYLLTCDHEGLILWGSEVDLDGNIKGEIKEGIRILPYQIRTYMINFE